MAAQTPASDLLHEGIRALAHGNSTELERLAEAACRARLPETTKERSLARLNLRTLSYLLVLTQRNLRLLRGAGGAYGCSTLKNRQIESR